MMAIFLTIKHANQLHSIEIDDKGVLGDCELKFLPIPIVFPLLSLPFARHFDRKAIYVSTNMESLVVLQELEVPLLLEKNVRGI